MTNDAKWDRRLGIRTAGRDGAAEDAHHRAYEPTPYAVLERLAESGWITEDSLAADYGCGKGRVSLFLCRATGCRSIGIDFNPAMIAAAEENRRSMKVRADAVFLAEAAERWDVPPEADRFYFFNPFSVGILQSVLARIIGSVYEHPRPVLLFFYYPSEEYVRLLTHTDELVPAGELDCRDLCPGDERERILVFGCRHTWAE